MTAPNVGLAVPTASASIAPTGTTGLVTYDVHEWGLVRADQGDTVRIGAVAPELPVLDMDKPVLYFRADAPLTLRRVSITAPGGSILETWPLAERGIDKQSAGWSSISLDPFSPCKSSLLPRKTDPPCAALRPGDQCEAPELAVVRSVDSSCVRVGDKLETFLFYRVATKTLTPPLRFINHTDSITVTNDGVEAIPGVLIRIDTSVTETRTMTVEPPPPLGSIDVARNFHVKKGTEAPPPTVENDGKGGEPPPHPFSGSGREDLRVTMRDLGMVDAEIDAFLKAWDVSVFGTPTRESGFRAITSGTSFLYFLPASTLERVAKVTFDPPPRSFRRAFAVWTHVPENGESR